MDLICIGIIPIVYIKENVKDTNIINNLGGSLKQMLEDENKAITIHHNRFMGPF